MLPLIYRSDRFGSTMSAYRFRVVLAIRSVLYPDDATAATVAGKDRQRYKGILPKRFPAAVIMVALVVSPRPVEPRTRAIGSMGEIGHNLLMIGPPGEGKSLIAGALPGILPRLSNEEKVELTKIYSACGKLEHDAMAVTRRPMRSIHHGVSPQALVGGGSGVPRPGEITLSHLGVLFLDELPEFSRGALEVLRQPIESGRVTVSRVKMSLDFPSRFTLVAAMNPCPCGYYGTNRCSCNPKDVKKYLGKLSGPLIDRIDLQVELRPLSTDERFAENQDGLSDRMRAKVEVARQRQRVRFQGADIPYNAAIPGGHVRERCAFSLEGFERFKTVIDENTLSTRSMDRLAKVARTVADLADQDAIGPPHVDRAAKYVIGGMLREMF